MFCEENFHQGFIFIYWDKHVFYIPNSMCYITDIDLCILKITFQLWNKTNVVIIILMCSSIKSVKITLKFSIYAYQSY